MNHESLNQSLNPIFHELMLSTTDIHLSKPAKCSYEPISVHIVHDSATQLSTILTHMSLYYCKVFINTINKSIILCPLVFSIYRPNSAYLEQLVLNISLSEYNHKLLLTDFQLTPVWEHHFINQSICHSSPLLLNHFEAISIKHMQHHTSNYSKDKSMICRDVI
jgi:hypothetical protein